MKSGRFFWGAFLIALGALMLLQRMNVYALDWQFLWRFWPLILVFWGAAILSRGTRFAPVAAALAGITLAAIGATMVEMGLDFEGVAPDRGGHTEEFTQPFDKVVHRGTFRFDSGAGTFTLDGPTEQLVAASVRADFGRYVLKSERIENSEDVSLRFEGEKKTWTFSRSANRVGLRFNPAIPWDMSFAVGASRLDLDLSPFRIERVAIEAGASQVRVRLGDIADETRLSVKSGVSSIRVLVPHGSACEISTDSPLSRKSFKGFSRTDEGTYRTENFATAEKKIFIALDSGISNLTVVRY